MASHLLEEYFSWKLLIESAATALQWIASGMVGGLVVYTATNSSNDGFLMGMFIFAFGLGTIISYLLNITDKRLEAAE